jgi:hypothetical protein
MIDVFHAVSACGDLVAYWEIGRHHGGVLLRATSRVAHATEPAAKDAAQLISERLRPRGYDAREVTVGARPTVTGEPAWHALVEMIVSRRDGLIVD